MRRFRDIGENVGILTIIMGLQFVDDVDEIDKLPGQMESVNLE